jgi:hypothetical protein
MTISTIIGIDPASSSAKKTMAVKVYLDLDGGLKDVEMLPLSHQELIEEKEMWKQDTLVLWDAPLTGVPLSWPVESEGHFTRRPLEQELEKLTREEKGISVLGFGCGCPHLPLTQYLFGLPKMGRYDQDPKQLPLVPVFQQEKLFAADDGVDKRARIVEVHPAVALWAWLKKDGPPNNDWHYKKKEGRKNRSKWVKALTNLWAEEGAPKIWEQRNLKTKAEESDDVFDALIAAVLGLLAIKKCDGLKVKLYGNKDAGAMLLPECEAFDKMKLTPDSHGTKCA